MPIIYRLLVIDDDTAQLELVAEALTVSGYHVRAFSDPMQALMSFEKNPCDLVFTDLQMPGLGGNDVLKKVKSIDAAIPVLLASAFGSVQSAVQAMKDGAFDFLTKPFEIGHLLEVVKRALEFRNLQRENKLLRHQVADFRGSRIAPAGSSSAMKKVLASAQSVAATEATVLISGESGTGKEILADFIQRHSRRQDGPYIKINCGALSGTLLESELFGHEKGAFTGAIERRAGRFEQAQKGTIFLDEIGELSLEAQTRLLRVLQQRELQRVGGSTTVTLDIRVICATHRNLQALLAEGKFREDLFYRINVFPLYLPPLRERRGDIPALAVDLLLVAGTRIGHGPKTISQDALDRLATCDWPGNIRQLENILERCAILCSGEILQVSDLPDEIMCSNSIPAVFRATGVLQESRDVSGDTKAVNDLPTLDDVRHQAERQRIVVSLEKCQWNLAEAAMQLGIGRSTLYGKLTQYKIEK